MNLKDLHPWVRYLVVIVALGGIVFEASRPEAPRFWLLVTYTGMLGITSLVGLDRVAQRIGPGQQDPPPGGEAGPAGLPAGDPPPPPEPAAPPDPQAIPGPAP